MSTEFPDQSTLRSALSLAIRAPSVHNSQPWRWHVADHSLHLYADFDRHLPRTDPDGRDLTVSCGAAIHHCAVALAALGWQATVRRFPDPLDPRHLAAIELHRRAPAELDIALAAAIPRRRTDRRRYTEWPVPERNIALMSARAAREGVTLLRVEDFTGLRHTVNRAAATHARDSDYLRELTAWSGRYASAAGVPARSAPRPDSAARLPGRLFAGPALAQPEGTTPEDDNAMVLALGTRDDRDVTRLRAGEAMSLVLLTATAHGLATCPITEPLEVPETRAAVRAAVFGENEFPQMLIRVGWAPVNADPLPATPRWPLADVVTRGA